MITPGGGSALVADFQTTTVTPIDLSTMAPGPAIAVGGNPTGIVGAPASEVAYVSGGDSITPIDLQTDAPGKPIGVDTTAEALAVAPGGTTAWVAGGDGTLVSVDLADGTVIRRVHVGNHPSAVVMAGGRGSSG